MTREYDLSEIRIRDPFVLRTESSEYVLFGTTDEYVWGGPATGFDCYVSDDLLTWSGPIAAFRPPEGFWSTSQFWAPEVYRFGNRYVMIATFLRSSTGIRGVATLVSDHATGPFEAWSEGPVTPADVPCLDGTLHVDEKGMPWLVYSRGAEGVSEGVPPLADGEMYAMQLTADLRRAASQPTLLFRASDAVWSKPMRLPGGAPPSPELGLATDPLFTDGPFLVRTTTGELLMLWSSFGEEGYAMGVAKSESGGVLGPWRHSPTPLWERNGGHGMILQTSEGAHYLVFHAPNDSPKERAVLLPVVIAAESIRLGEPD